jgi:hypothetical protein
MKKNWTYWMSIAFTIIGIIIFAWFCIRGYLYEGFINPSGEIILEKSAQFGDFIGGCTGAIFALVGVFLLFATLKSQREEFSESRNVFYKQQFDNTFFGLLELYRSIVDTLSAGNEAGRSFFVNEKTKLQTTAPDTTLSFIKRKKQADDLYVSFYIQHKNQVAHYFRTLYRIFCFIDNSELKEREKVEYAKIMRAQLSESELFFLYYNAFTSYGYNFQYIINKYNLIKHLPFLEKLEYQKYTSLLEGTEKHSVELVLLDIRRLINSSMKYIGQDNPKYNIKTYLKGKYGVKVFFPSNNLMELNIIIKHNQQYSIFFQQGLGLDRFSEDILVNLFRDYLLDSATYCSFFKANLLTEVYINSSIEHFQDSNKSIISFKFSRKDNTMIRFNPCKEIN